MNEPPKPTLRYARPSDAFAVGAYHLRCWQTAYRGLIPDSMIDAMNVEANRSYSLSPTDCSGSVPGSAEGSAERELLDQCLN